MKKIIRKSIATSIAVFLSVTLSLAQLSGITNMLSGGTDDAELMLTEYIRPLTNSIGANLNGGWYNTAKVHKLGGFDITFTTSVAFTPAEHKTYNLDDLALSSGIRYDNTIPPKTFAGAKGAEPTIRYVIDVPTMGEQEIVSYDHPGGSGMNMMINPMINASIGLVFGTEIGGRYMPTIKFGNKKANSVGLWGICVKHDIKQWIPGVKNVPVLNMSLMYGFTKLDLHSNITPLTPDLMGVDPSNVLTSTTDWDNQSLDMIFKSHTGNFLISADLPIVCFYGGAGFSITKANLNLNGNFPIPTMVTTPADPNFGEVVVTDASMVTDPFDIEIKNQDGGTTAPRLNAGIRFKFAIITLHFDYTWANYSVATVGLGISFR